MTLHRVSNWALAFSIATILSCTYLLDGPTELEAAQAVAEELHDAPKYVASHADYTGARGQNDHKTLIAAVRP
jgi:hypothetical protein